MTRKHWIDLLLGLVLTALILTGVEGALGMAGLGQIPEAPNWSRGFDPDARYLVPHGEPAGSWQTRFKHIKYPEITVPANSDKVRVLTFGGSNTHGFPTNYLERILNRRCKGGGRSAEFFEVFNLGRPGYGSERVKFIFEQAIDKLDPEVVILYTGHNEFVERGFQMDLELTSPGLWAKGPQAVARRTRMFNTISQYYSTDGSKRNSEPEAWDNEYSKFADITYDETQTYFDAYEVNLRAMCQMAAAKNIRVILSTVVYNRLAVPFSSTFDEEATWSDIRDFESKRQAALDNLPAYLATLLPQEEEQRLHGSEFAVSEVDPKSTAPELDYSRFEGWSTSKGLFADRSPDLSHPSRWAPIVRTFYGALESLQHGELGEKNQTDLEKAEKLLEEALTLCPNHPRAMFELALTKTLLQRTPKAVGDLFTRAASFDRAPRKGSEATNDIVRRVAKTEPGITLLDLDSVFRRSLPNGLIGWEWMADHCHLNQGARDAAMEIFSRTILWTWPDILEETREQN